MSIKTINVGTVPNDGTGEPLRDAFGKVNENFAELDLLKAPKDSPALTGAPTAPTQAADNNTTRVATTAFVVAQAGTAAPVMAGAAAVGTSLRYARQDHKHPSDTTRAPVASPTFTGTPAAPTAAVGTNTTQLATTAYVQAAANGIFSKSVAGGANVTLTAAEAGYAIIKLTGAITANISVILPAAAGKWTVWNTTTGAFSVTVKTAAGTGVDVTQGTAWGLICDGTNVIDGISDFKDIALTGAPTAPTQAADNNSTRVATTAFIAGQAGTASPVMDGTVAVGTSLRYARQDHRHPVDTSRAALASPAFSGTPTAPTPAVNDNSTKLATTAYVQANSYWRNNILGTVSQSAGVPTGAVIERGSNASGEYVRFADGTQMCWASYAGTESMSFAYGGLFVSTTGQPARSFPAAFVGSVNRQSVVSSSSAGIMTVLRTHAAGNVWGTQQTAAAVQVSDAYVVHEYCAVGRWY